MKKRYIVEDVQRIGQYTHPQTGRQRLLESWLLVNLGNVDRAAATLPSGAVLTVAAGHPSAMLLPAGSKYDFAYGEGRENWIIPFSPETMTETSAGAIRFSHKGFEITAPALCDLDPIQAERCRTHLTRLLEAFYDDQQAAAKDLVFYALLDCILNAELLIHQEEPAEALRRRIIADRSFEQQLSELSNDCGYSQAHLRRLFEKRFGVTPKAFRTEYRMAIACNLLEQGVPVLEVSKHLGYRYPTHFSAAFKLRFGYPPAEHRATPKPPPAD